MVLNHGFFQGFQFHGGGKPNVKSVIRVCTGFYRSVTAKKNKVSVWSGIWLVIHQLGSLIESLFSMIVKWSRPIIGSIWAGNIGAKSNHSLFFSEEL